MSDKRPEGRRGRRPYEPMRLTRHTFGAISKYSGSALNTRAPLVPTTVVDRIDGCDVPALIRRFGSPLFVVSQARLQQDLYAAIDTADLRARTQPLGFELIPSTARQMRERVEADSATYAPLAREGRVAKT